jgi:hypothetical protein
VLAEWLRRNRVPLATYGAVASVLLVVSHISNRVVREVGYAPLPWKGLRAYVDGWFQFDGPEYARIATEGYWYTAGERTPVVWFPLYPGAMRAVDAVVGDIVVAGVLVSLAAGAVASLLCWAWLGDQGMAGRTRTVAFLTFALYPYGYYLYGVVYADALALAAILGAFVLVGRGHPVLAGLVGALATATRPTAGALVPALLLLALERDGVLRHRPDPGRWATRLRLPTEVHLDALRARTLAPLLALAGIGSYMGYLWWRWGNPLLFVENQAAYHPEDAPILKKAFAYKLLHAADDPTQALTLAAQAVVAVVVFCSIPAVARRFGAAYGAFAALLLAFPVLSSGDFMGTGRYLMAAFPVAALLGERLAASPPAVARWVLGASGALMVLLAWGFSRSWYLT